MQSASTLLFVHAHPDDEAFFGAGAVAHYTALGQRVVLVTCTNGQLGIDPSGLEGNQADHDDVATKVLRAFELQQSADLLGFSRVITLGYDDSGMADWAQHQALGAFVNADVEAVSTTLARIIDEIGARVVVTYDEDGFYGHPDHVFANVLTRRAVALSKSAERLYYPVVPEGVITRFRSEAAALGLSLPAWVLKAGSNVSDDMVSTTLDVREYCALKQRAMAAHASQIDNAELVSMNAQMFELLFATEYYQRAWSRSSSSGDENDLLGGI